MVKSNADARISAHIVLCEEGPRAPENTESKRNISPSRGWSEHTPFAMADRNENIERSARNIDRTTLTTVAQLNAWDLLRARTLVVTRDGFEELLNGPKKAAPAATASA